MVRVAEFALDFDGYARRGGFEPCARIGNGVLAEFERRSGCLPPWLSMRDLRTALFFEQRRWHHLGETPDGRAGAYFAALLSEIRDRAEFGERVAGALIGLAVGDCLGAPLEGKAPRSVPVRDFLYRCPTWTDDTQQALVLAEATVRVGRPDPVWVGRRYVEMAQAPVGHHFGLHRGTGRGFRESVRAFARDGDWRRSGRPDRAGSGAAMRVVPAALALSVRMGADALRTAIVEVSLLTHREVRALTGALAVAELGHLLARRGPCRDEAEQEGLVAELAVVSRDLEDWLADEFGAVIGAHQAANGAHLHQFSTGLAGLASCWNGGWPAREAWIVDHASRCRGEHCWPGAGYVLASVVSAIAITLAAPTLEAAVVTAVNLGGDADTVGAMVGALAGAAWGPDAIPERWRRFEGSGELVAWAWALAELTDTTDLPDLIALEQRLCALVRGGG